MDKYRKIFNQYFKKFDIKEKNILMKFHHSYRVMEYSKSIGKFLELNEHDMWLCEIIGLFHDISRFEQWTKYKTFWDKESVDHGDLSCEIIEREKILDDIDSVDKNIILTAIKYHNKYDIKDVKDERTILFCKIIRDADKIDILLEQVNEVDEMQKELSEQLLEVLYEKRMCPNEYVVTSVDNVLRHIGFIFDLNFSHSIKILKEKKWFENKFNILQNYVEKKENIYELEEFITEYVKEKIKC